MIPYGNINRQWVLCGYSDADYSGDIDNWKIMT